MYAGSDYCTDFTGFCSPRTGHVLWRTSCVRHKLEKLTEHVQSKMCFMYRISQVNRGKQHAAAHEIMDDTEIKSNCLLKWDVNWLSLIIRIRIGIMIKNEVKLYIWVTVGIKGDLTALYFESIIQVFYTCEWMMLHTDMTRGNNFTYTLYYIKGECHHFWHVGPQISACHSLLSRSLAAILGRLSTTTCSLWIWKCDSVVYQTCHYLHGT